MKQKFSSLFVLLVLLLTGLQVSAQSTPKPFDIEQPSLRVFLPAPELATGRAVVACPGGGSNTGCRKATAPSRSPMPKQP